MLEKILSNPIAALFLVVTIGRAIGVINIRGISLGSSAVLFVALALGHFGLVIPKAFTDLGMILFVYAVGLQAGPRFFTTFRQQGLTFAKIGFLTIVSGVVVTWAAARGFGVPAPLAAGMFAGALTSTPGLAAAVDTLSDVRVSVGFGIAYPFGVLGVVLFVQMIPRLAAKRMAQESLEKEKAQVHFRVATRQYRIDNPLCEGKTLMDLDLHGMTRVNISRVRQGDTMKPARSDIVLHLGDMVVAVGPPEELAKLEYILGPETPVEQMPPGEVIVRDVYVSDSRVAGKTIAELEIAELYGVVITRLYREDIELVPTGSSHLEIGDLIRVVGSPEDCERFVAFIGRYERRIHETPLLPFSIGIVLGVLLGYFPIPLPGGVTARLGLAGGPLLVGLLLGYFGRVGPLRLRTPYAVRYLLRELGLVFFLAGVGAEAGSQFLEVFRQEGVALLGIGAVVTVVPMAVAFALARYRYHFDFPHSLGTVCGSMTSTPGLGALCTSLNSDEPAVAYATVYPVALIAVTIAAQLLSLFL